MRSGFFNSIDGDRKYDADDISNYFLKLISNGVFATPANSMQIQATTGMKVKVTPGWAWVSPRNWRIKIWNSIRSYAGRALHHLRFIPSLSPISQML